jgi:3-methyladenine DNA glycosylase AlkD
MARYGIKAERAFGVSMGTMLSLQKRLGKDHALAATLWESGWYGHEFRKRAAFALIASLALHDKTAPDRKFLVFLPLIEKGAQDERNFVKKGVSWALRGIGRRSQALNTAAVKVARRLAHSKDAAPRWVGKDALRELTSPKVRSQLAGRSRVDSARPRSSRP